MLATLEGIDKMARASGSHDPNLPYWMLTLGLGLALTRAAIAWGESALAELAAMDVDAGEPLKTSEAEPSS
jgi:hypothetical protein